VWRPELPKPSSEAHLDSKWAAHFVPGADMRPAPPSCVHHMIRYLVRLYGATVRNTFWGDRLRRRRRNDTAWRQSHPCQSRRANGSPCCASAKRGSLYCHAHQPRPQHLWSLSPRSMGLRCTATSVTTGMQCKNCAVRPHCVCWQHGAKAIRAARAFAARPYNAADAAARQKKQQRHRDMPGSVPAAERRRPKRKA
jgi:hypothetical protein